MQEPAQRFIKYMSKVKATGGAEISFSRRDDEERPNYKLEDEGDIYDVVIKFQDAHPELSAEGEGEIPEENIQ